MIRLSKEVIDSFAGNVVSLRLDGVTDKDRVTWKAEGDCLRLTTFDKDEEPYFAGVLVTLLFAGRGRVTAEIDGRVFSCAVAVRAMRHTEPSGHLKYYIGDLHDHTSGDHNKKTFKLRGEKDFPKQYLQQVKEEGILDFTAISDHACLLNAREFFRGFDDDATTDPKDLIVFSGSEAEVTVRETDRYGISHKCSGEIVTLNTGAWANTYSWDDYFHRVEQHPFTFATFAHPQIIGYSTPGVWNFCLDQNNSPRFLRLFRLIETGDGSDRQSNLINEYMYSVALDNGFHVSPTCSSDSHGPHWGAYRFPGKTVIMAPEKSKEAFLDAIMHNRVYATSSGNVKLYYEVNGTPAPATLDDTADYHFSVSISYFENRITDQIEHCQVISDEGACLLDFDCTGKSDFSFDLHTDTAHYFYLRLFDHYGKKTWSCPVWTGRPLPVQQARLPLIAVPKEGFSAVDEVSGKDASVLLCDDPHQAFRSEKTTCAIVIDMHRTEEISALSHYPKILSQSEIIAEGWIAPHRIAFLPSRYRLSTSLDGTAFSVQKEGRFRVFGAEEFITFSPTRARFIKLEILSTVGKESRRQNPSFADALVDMAELTVWKKEE